MHRSISDGAMLQGRSTRTDATVQLGVDKVLSQPPLNVVTGTGLGEPAIWDGTAVPEEDPALSPFRNAADQT